LSLLARNRKHKQSEEVRLEAKANKVIKHKSNTLARNTKAKTATKAKKGTKAKKDTKAKKGTK
jgi:hypothetical protein